MCVSGPWTHLSSHPITFCSTESVPPHNISFALDNLHVILGRGTKASHFVHLNQPIFLLVELNIDGLLSFFFYTLLRKTKLFLVIELESHASNPETLGCKYAFKVFHAFLNIIARV